MPHLLQTSILSAGTFVGALASGYVGTFFGRRVGLGIYLVLFCVGVAMQTAAHDVPLFAVGRVFAGLGVGGVSCLVPIYQSECSPKEWRGFIVSACVPSLARSTLRSPDVHSHVTGTSGLSRQVLVVCDRYGRLQVAKKLTGRPRLLPSTTDWSADCRRHRQRYQRLRLRRGLADPYRCTSISRLLELRSPRSELTAPLPLLASGPRHPVSRSLPHRKRDTLDVSSLHRFFRTYRFR